MTALSKLRWMVRPIAVSWGIIDESPAPATVPDTAIKQTFTQWGEKRQSCYPKRLTLLIRSGYRG
jgi:hypothetical protein